MVADAASNETPCIALRMETENAWITASVMVDSRKKPKHHHTTGNFRKARSPPSACGSPVLRAATSVCSLSRLSTQMIRIIAIIKAAHR